MATKRVIHIAEELLTSLANVTWTQDYFQGYLFGQKTEEKNIVVGFARTSCVNGKKVDQTYVTQHLAGGLKVCGGVIRSDEDPMSDSFSSNFDSFIIDTNYFVFNDDDDGDVLILCIGKGPVTGNNFYWLSEDDGKIHPAKIESRDHSILSESLLTRVKTNIDLTCLVPNKDTLKRDIEREIHRICSDLRDGGSFSFAIENTEDKTLMLTLGDVFGLKKNSMASSLLEYLPNLKSGQEVALSLNVYQRLSTNNVIPTCAPFIQHNIGEEKCLLVELPIDVLCLVPLDIPIKDVYQIICDSISRQIQAMGSNIVEFAQDEKVYLPEPFHFQPPNSDYFLTVVYPKHVSIENLESSRRTLHEVFCLPFDKPVFKRNNRYIFGREGIPGGYLLNPHTSLNLQPLKDSKYYLVQGNYTYHHYMQDKFDDNKWGCAYRSLQTLCSWFKYQGYTERPVPTHKEIQQALVDIGDKDPKFVGSRNWIGSLEVSYCLENLIGVTSKILSVSAGAELANKGRELAQHFTQQGTPVMIGGGVLAHTILGINFSEVTGDIKFLILDPHYTGGENIQEIIGKGWCGWKGPEFWDQTAMYNMCLPQRPSHVI